jgi:cytoskeletal protein RodZ
VSDTVTNSSETSSNSPGAILKRCREYHDLTLEDASETTKIGISYLKALEEDQIREFANLTYLKGFLRIYASYLGLNSDDMARMYDKLHGAKDQESDNDVNATRKDRPAGRMVSLQKLALPAFLLLLILITATFFKRSPSSPVIQPQPIAAVAPAVTAAPVQQILSSAKAVTTPPEIAEPRAERLPKAVKTDDAPSNSKQPADTAKGFILKIRVTQNGSMSVTVDGSAPQNYELTVGDIIEWKAEKTVALEVSNAGGIDVELNGKPHKPLGPSGKPLYVELDADGVKQ